ncbi:hypothetical protein BDV33DRAFT_171710, partial [Aspergillus novoparasiticus]
MVILGCLVQNYSHLCGPIFPFFLVLFFLALTVFLSLPRLLVRPRREQKSREKEKKKETQCAASQPNGKIIDV